jgi:transposase
VRWREAGVWDRTLDAVSAAYAGDLIMIDSSCVRVHQHGATGKKGDHDGGMGRSRGGMSTKIHALVDAEGRPIRIALTPGQAHDGIAAEELLTNLEPGATLVADKVYDSNAIREQAQEQDVWANIPPKTNRKGSFVSAPFCTATEIWSRASLTGLNGSAALPRDMTRTMRTSWPPSS